MFCRKDQALEIDFINGISALQSETTIKCTVSVIVSTRAKNDVTIIFVYHDRLDKLPSAVYNLAFIREKTTKPQMLSPAHLPAIVSIPVVKELGKWETEYERKFKNHQHIADEQGKENAYFILSIKNARISDK